MLKELFKKVREEKLSEEPTLSIKLFDEGVAHHLSKEEVRVLLQEAIYLLRDKCGNSIEEELMEQVEEYHEELFEDEEV